MSNWSLQTRNSRCITRHYDTCHTRSTALILAGSQEMTFTKSPETFAHSSSRDSAGLSARLRPLVKSIGFILAADWRVQRAQVRGRVVTLTGERLALINRDPGRSRC